MASLEILTGRDYLLGSEMESSKLCRKCQSVKPLTEFHASSKASDGKQTYCRECHRAMYRDRYNRNPEAHRERSRETNKRVRAKVAPGSCSVSVGHEYALRRHGVDASWYESVIAAQGWGCAICGSSTPGSGVAYFAVDHDHSCCPGSTNCPSCVRALLCSDCNTTLGKMKDNPALLRKAADYLEAHGGNTA